MVQSVIDKFSDGTFEVREIYTDATAIDAVDIDPHLKRVPVAMECSAFSNIVPQSMRCIETKFLDD
jgi:hypothetical protein